MQKLTQGLAQHLGIQGIPGKIVVEKCAESITRKVTLAALILSALAAPAHAEAAAPIMVGRDGPDLDACSAIGRVARLGAPPFDKLTVRERPDALAAPKDRLERRTLVWLCDAQGEWQGVVYPAETHQELGECGFGSPVPAPTAYDGPCRFGWVTSKNIELVAG